MTPLITGRRPWLTFVLDVGPVVVLVVLWRSSSASSSASSDWPRPWPSILPLLVRRRWPFPVFVLVAVLAVRCPATCPTPWIPVAGRRAGELHGRAEASSDRTRSALGIIARGGAHDGRASSPRTSEPVQSLVLPFVVVMPAWLIGDVFRTRSLDGGALRGRSGAARFAQQEDRLRAAVAEERRHDGPGAPRRGGARRERDGHPGGRGASGRPQTSPDQADEALLTIEATGREAMAELRRLLGVLNDDGEAAGLAPQPGLEPARGARRAHPAGGPARRSSRSTARRRPCRRASTSTVYRIVQEALTNALRYARRPGHASPPDATSRTSSGSRSSMMGRPRRADPAEGSGRGPGRHAGAGHARQVAGSRRDRVWAAGTPSGRLAARCRVEPPVGDELRDGAVTGRRRCARPVIADDQALVRAGFRMILEAQADVDGGRRGGRTATAAVRLAHGGFDRTSC